MKDYFSYWELKQKLLRPMLGTCPNVDIYAEHLLTKTKKLIEKAGATNGKLSKKIEKYLGTELPEQKEIDEIKGLIRNYESILGEKFDLPDSLPELMALNKELSDRCTELSKQDELKCTTFLKDENGFPVISSHMVLGNVKEILRTIINSGDKFCFKSKTQLGECSALDLKVVERFLKPSNDILRDPNGERHLNIRPIRFEYMGKSVTALAASEELPIDTIFTSTLRIRKGSPLDEHEVLHKIFSMGKSLGLGSWRSSGNYGAYCFQIKLIEGFKEDFGEWE